MRTCLIILITLGCFTEMAFAKTETTIVFRQMTEMRVCMMAYAREHGVLLSGENAKVVGKLREYGLAVPSLQQTEDGSYLDTWGTPYYFIETSEGEVVILSLGKKVGSCYTNPEAVIVPKPKSEKP